MALRPGIGHRAIASEAGLRKAGGRGPERQSRFQGSAHLGPAPGSGRSVRRPSRLLVLGALCLAGVLGLDAAARHHRIEGWEMQWRARQHETWPRRAATEEREGIFLDLATQGLRTLTSTWSAAPPDCSAVLSRGPGRLDSSCAPWVEERWPAAESVLGATEARLGSWDLRNSAAESGMAEAGLVSALRVSIDLDRGQEAEAEHICLLALSLARDAETTGNFGGLQEAFAIARDVFHPCAEALDAVDPQTKLAAANSIAAILDGLPPASRLYKADALSVAGWVVSTEAARWDRLVDEWRVSREIENDEFEGEQADHGGITEAVIRDQEDAFHFRPSGPILPRTLLVRWQGVAERLRLLRELCLTGATRQLGGQWPRPQPPYTLSISPAHPLDADLRAPTADGEGGELSVLIHAERPVTRIGDGPLR